MALLVAKVCRWYPKKDASTVLLSLFMVRESTPSCAARVTATAATLPRHRRCRGSTAVKQHLELRWCPEGGARALWCVSGACAAAAVLLRHVEVADGAAPLAAAQRGLDGPAGEHDAELSAWHQKGGREGVSCDAPARAVMDNGRFAGREREGGLRCFRQARRAQSTAAAAPSAATVSSQLNRRFGNRRLIIGPPPYAATACAGRRCGTPRASATPAPCPSSRPATRP